MIGIFFKPNDAILLYPDLIDFYQHPTYLD
jgi:hypothetical protein